MPAGRSSRRRLLLALAALATAAVVALPLLWIALPDPAPLARENPRTTALIEQRRDEAKERHRAFRPRQAWVGLDRISPRLVRAVLASEDANFWGHDGIDWDAVQDAARRDLEQRRFAVGASTITQQLAKNLWYGTEKSLWRKVKEAVLARKLERALPKRRILALYLNVAEWGDGVFGIEAGARARFGTSAAGLDTAQAVVMASMLPAPRRVDLSHPSTWLKRRSRRLLDRLRAAGRISADEHRHASAELDRILAGPAPRDDREEPPEEEAAPPPTASAPLAADAASPDAPSPVAKAAAPAAPGEAPPDDAPPSAPAAAAPDGVAAGAPREPGEAARE